MNQYYVIGKDGKKYGPAEVDTLTQWASEGRLSASSEVEEASTGRRMMARDIDGIILPETPDEMEGGWSGGPTPPAASNPYASPRPSQPEVKQDAPSNPYSQQPPGNPYGQQTPQNNPFAQPPSNYPRTPTGAPSDLDKKVTTSWILIAIGFFCCFILTIVGTVMAYDAKQKGHPGANAPFIVGIVLLVLSLSWTVFMFLGMMTPVFWGF